MRLSFWCRFLVLAGLLLSAPACTKKDTAPVPPDMKFGQTVRGKVTYKGKPVPYGFVLLYHPQASLDVKTGSMAPAAVGSISKDGSYELKNAPSGPAVFCVAADPDIQPMELLQPSPMGAGVRPRENASGPPSAGPSGLPGGPPGFPGGEQGGPPGMPMPPPPRGGPPGGPAGGPGAGPPRPRIMLPPGMDFNPVVKELSKPDRQMLKTIHEKYGAFGRSPLQHVIEEGEQAYDLKLD